MALAAHQVFTEGQTREIVAGNCDVIASVQISDVVYSRPRWRSEVSPLTYFLAPRGLPANIFDAGAQSRLFRPIPEHLPQNRTAHDRSLSE